MRYDEVRINGEKVSPELAARIAPPLYEGCLDERTGRIAPIQTRDGTLPLPRRMSKVEYAQFVEGKLTYIRNLIKAKNHDYTAGADDAFANFRRSEPKVSCLEGAWVRWGDKIQRVDAAFKTEGLKVKGEPLEAALEDVIGYSLIMLGILEEARRCEQASTGSGHGPVCR